MGGHTRIFLDIETVPDQRPGAEEAARNRIQAPANYKDPEKIEAYVAGKGREAWRKTSLNGAYGEIFCIGYALGDEEATVIHRDTDDPEWTEKALLESFWEMLGNDLSMTATWVGHNVQRFDLRFIWQRSVIHGVPMPMRLPFDASPWSKELADTMMMWTGERNSFISLDDLLDILGVESRDPISGADVWDAIEAGDSHLVVRHCLRNVEEVREAWRRMMLFPS